MFLSPYLRRERESREAALLNLRRYQEPVFWSELGILIVHWSRQIGKSYTLMAWAVYRLLMNPGRLVTVLSNSKSNGTECITKAAEVARLWGLARETADLSPDHKIENMRMEIRIPVDKKVGRIIVLAANPRTARGFSGDLILDEFAFHEDSAAIWDAAEPIISSNPGFQCRIASTGNGRFNMFYKLASETSSYMVEPRKTERGLLDGSQDLRSGHAPGNHAGGGPRCRAGQGQLRSKLRVRL